MTSSALRWISVLLNKIVVRIDVELQRRSDVKLFAKVGKNACGTCIWWCSIPADFDYRGRCKIKKDKFPELSCLTQMTQRCDRYCVKDGGQ